MIAARPRLALTVLFTGVVAAAGGCFSPTYPIGLQCGMNGECPPDQSCGADNVCRPKGEIPDAAVPDAGAPPCTPKDTRPCYDGPAGSDTGMCHGGTQTCQNDHTWGTCDGEVTPDVQCTGRVCGDDGCGGSCGLCTNGMGCASDGTCTGPSMAMIILQTPFTMGSPDTEPGHKSDELAHTVSLTKHYFIDINEVTNAAYLDCVVAGACEPPTTCDSGTPVWTGPQSFPAAATNHPVTCVSWDMAKTYCETVGKRLCTEAEWEAAAGWDDATAMHRAYPWGDLFPSDPSTYLNCTEAYCADGYEQTAPVGSFPAGAAQPQVLFDMAGNVSEWVLDWYDAAYYANGAQTDPQGPCDGASPCAGHMTRVIRGGNYLSDNLGVRTAARGQRLPQSRDPFTGIRCCADQL